MMFLLPVPNPCGTAISREVGEMLWIIALVPPMVTWVTRFKLEPLIIMCALALAEEGLTEFRTGRESTVKAMLVVPAPLEIITSPETAL